MQVLRIVIQLRHLSGSKPNIPENFVNRRQNSVSKSLNVQDIHVIQTKQDNQACEQKY